MNMRPTAEPAPSGNSQPRGRWSAPRPLSYLAPTRPTTPVDEVLDAGLDSFPASDPPSWSPLRIGASAA